jgi:hypothetical protein
MKAPVKIALPLICFYYFRELLLAQVSGKKNPAFQAITIYFASHGGF